MTRKHPRLLKLASVVMVFGASLWVSNYSAKAQELGPGGRVITGDGQFRAHCAQCHGMDGKGEGPMAPALKVKPMDLTLLAKQNGGVFPEEKVFNSINGHLTDRGARN